LTHISSIKKTVNRAGTTVSFAYFKKYRRPNSHIANKLLHKTGQIDRTVDREFADEETEYKMCVYFSLKKNTSDKLRLDSITQNQIRERMPGTTEG
jgi:hypothetical protein